MMKPRIRDRDKIEKRLETMRACVLANYYNYSNTNGVKQSDSTVFRDEFIHMLLLHFDTHTSREEILR
jgi:hypothetical protein